ncbi:hypothetical protein VoSk93_43810 [Vibrio owensii]
MTLPSSIKALLKALVLTVIILTFVAAGQAAQYITSSKSFVLRQSLTGRAHTLNKAHWWINMSPSVSTKRNTSLNTLILPQQPISIYDCGKAIGAHDLMQEMQYIDRQLSTLAWPLSLIE